VFVPDLQPYNRCTADEIYVRLSLLMLAPRASVLDLVHIGLLHPILLRLSMFAPVWHLVGCQRQSLLLCQFRGCGRHVGLCHYNSSSAFPDDITRVLCVQLPLYRGCAEKQALAAHHSGGISGPGLRPFYTRIHPPTPTHTDIISLVYTRCASSTPTYSLLLL